MEGSPYWSAFGRRMARRRLLQTTGAGAAALGGAWALAACGGDDDDDDGGAKPAGGTATAGEPRKGGRFQAGNTVTFDTFDPHLSIAGGTVYFPRVYNVLVHQSPVKPDFIVNDLAQSYEQPDEATYVFKIRPGVKIAPNKLGVPERDLDAQDALTSFKRIQTEPRANAGGFVKQWLASVEAPDAKTVVMKTKGPYAWFLSKVGTFLATIPPRELLQGDPAVMRTNGVGAGPLALTKLVEGQGASFDRNPNYYNTKLPYIDGIDIRNIPDRAARRTAFVSRQIHDYIAASKSEADDLAKQGDFTVYNDPEFTFISFLMNAQRDPWKDPRVRRAASRALNRKQFIDVLHPGNAKPDGLVHWPTGPYALPEQDLETKYQPYNPAEAKKLLAEAGFPNGLKIKVIYPSFDPLPQYLPIFLDQFKAAGFEVEQSPQDLATWIDNTRKRNYDANLNPNQTYDAPDALNWHHSKGYQGDGSYGTGLGEPEIDRAIEKAHATINLEERIKAVHETQKLLYSKDPYFLPLMSWYRNTLFWKFVKNQPAGRGLGVTQYFLHDWWLEL